MDEDYLHDLFKEFGPVRIRKMFGGQALYREGLMFALVADGDLYLKTDQQTSDLFGSVGSIPFTYQGKHKPVTMSYWQVPDIALDDLDEMKYWAELAFEAALRAKK